jgi:hypothetical protein
MSLVDQVGGGLDGLSQLHALMASGRKPGILVGLDFEFVEVEAGRAVFAGTPGKRSYNPIGAVRGGYAATLLDSACACAVFLRLRRPVTKDTGLLRAEGQMLSFTQWWRSPVPSSRKRATIQRSLAWSTSQAFAPDNGESVASLIKDPRPSRPFSRFCRLRMDTVPR